MRLGPRQLNWLGGARYIQNLESKKSKELFLIKKFALCYIFDIFLNQEYRF